LGRRNGLCRKSKQVTQRISDDKSRRVPARSSGPFVCTVGYWARHFRRFVYGMKKSQMSADMIKSRCARQ
ncbi:MAG TPA: hypothetical protein PK003_10185, partial [Bacillota bacterium]|nr:hypothetical protein [Bacillota bacterium]